MSRTTIRAVAPLWRCGSIWHRNYGCWVADLNRLAKLTPGHDNAALPRRIPAHLSHFGSGWLRRPALPDFEFLALSVRAVALAPDRATVAFPPDADDVEDVSLRIGPVSEADLVADSDLLRHRDL